MDKSNLHKVFMNTAFEFATLSKCVSHKVGAVAVRDGRIIATGVNGTVPGYYNCSELFDINNFDREAHHQFSEKYECHAEMNLILYAAKNGIALNKSTLYVTLHPCWNCIKHISIVGIKDVWWYNKYDKLEDIDDINNYCANVGITLNSYKNFFEN